MRSTSPLPRRNGATRLEHRVPSSTSRLSTSLLPFPESLPTPKTRPHQVDLPVELSTRNELLMRAQIRKLRAISSKPARHEFRTGPRLRRGGTSSFRLIVLAPIGIAQAAANQVRCIDCTASQMIFWFALFCSAFRSWFAVPKI